MVMLPWLEAPLDAALAQARSHALLIQGPEGVGQFELAMALAQSWLCENPTSTGRACDACASCHLFKARTHPDLRVLLPEALQVALGWTDDGDSGRESKAKPSREIKIDAVRSMLGFAQGSSARGRAKVVVVHPAESLNTVAANALLKTLEEPAGQLRFALSSAAPESLLPTIRSRCQPLPVGLPDAALALPWLRERGLPDADAQVLLAAAGGRPQQALGWFEAGLRAEIWKRLPQQVRRGEALALKDWPPAQAIGMLQRLCHDLLRAAHGSAPSFFPAEALPATHQVQALHEWAASLRQAARHADHPLNQNLLLESLFAQGQRALA
ncbi:MAG: DNA polymerase III subunit delta' [Paucibacter sp.]|nr:DNA polymerase III subunit delta' [Roseateles sp.]